MFRSPNPFLLTAISIIVLSSVCIYLSSHVTLDFAPFCIAVIGAGVLTFSACVSNAQSNGKSWIADSGNVRTTIAVSLLVEYMVMVGIAAFIQQGSKELPQITQTILTSFTTVLGVIITFYFGASAYVQRQGRIREQKQSPQSTAGA
jgi:hypothetical protein